MRKSYSQNFMITMKYMGRNFWLYLIGVLGSNIIMVFCTQMVMAIIMKDLFNAANQSSAVLFNRAVLVGVTSLLIAVFIQPIFVFIAKKAQKSTMKEIRVKVYQHMIDLPVTYFGCEHSGTLLSRLTNDVQMIEEIYDVQINRIIYVILLGVGSSILMFVFDWRMALFALTFESMSIASSMLITKRLRDVSYMVQEKKGRTNEKLLDLIYGIKTTKMLQIEEDVIEEFVLSNDNLVRSEMKRNYLEAGISTCGHFFYSVKSVGMIVIGLYLISSGDWDMGTLIAMFNLQNNLGILSELGHIMGRTQGSFAGVARIEELLNHRVENFGEVDVVDGDICKDALIQFNEVTFNYKDRNVLDGISLELKKKESIALVGKSGCGKSTVAKLLLGFYEAMDGELSVIISGRKVNSKKRLRKMTSYVPQDSFLFEGTIMDNIRYGKLDATEKEILDAAMAANAHQFIMEKDDGYQTWISEGGRNLSGGQKQRIALARALVKGAEILVMDEATESLDKSDEDEIMETVERVMKEKTVIFITHRLETLVNVGSIYVLDKGKIVEKGNHERLLNNKGLYFNLLEKSVV